MRISRPHVQRPASGRREKAQRTSEQHAKRIAQLYILRARAARQHSTVSAYLDAALIAARRDAVPYADLGDELLVVTGAPRTSEALARVENSLRVATHAALRRRRVSATNEPLVAASSRACEGEGMALQLRKRVRVIDYWIDDSVAASGLGGVDVGDLDLDGVDRLTDADIGDVESAHDHRDACDRSCEVGPRTDRKDR